MAGAPGGLVVTADEQTAGRGRRGQRVVRAARLLLALLGAAAAIRRRPIRRCCRWRCRSPSARRPRRSHRSAASVKWPNDVWVDERKVAGVLVEARPDEGWAVIGVGLNVAIPQDDFPPELRETATSLLPTEAEGGLPPGGAPGVRRAREALNESLGRWVDASDDEVLAAFRARDALSGRRISWEGGEGTAEEIDERGHLVVEKADGERIALGAGEVHLAIER